MLYVNSLISLNYNFSKTQGQYDIYPIIGQYSENNLTKPLIIKYTLIVHTLKDLFQSKELYNSSVRLNFMDLNNQPIRQNNNQPQRNQYLSTSIKQRKTTSRVHVVREANSFNSKNIKTFLSVLIIGGLFAIPLVVVLLIGAFFGYYQVSGRIIPGVKIASSDVGGMLITEAALELEKTWNLDNQIVISSGLNTLVVKPSDLGLRLDPLASVQKAYHIGHKDTIVDRFGHLTISLTQGWQKIGRASCRERV